MNTGRAVSWAPFGHLNQEAYSVELVLTGSIEATQYFGLSTTIPIPEGEEASRSFVSLSGGIHLPPSLSKVSENKWV